MPGESPDVPCMALIPVAPLFQHRGWGGDLLLGWFAAKTKPCHAQVPPALLREPHTGTSLWLVGPSKALSLT